MLGDMPDERFALLVNLGKKITDYAIEKDTGGDGRTCSYYFVIVLGPFDSHQNMKLHCLIIMNSSS